MVTNDMETKYVILDGRTDSMPLKLVVQHNGKRNAKEDRSREGASFSKSAAT